jgi:hypothetical protein
MTYIENVIEIEYRIHKNQERAVAIVTTFSDHVRDMPGKAYDLKDINLFIRPGHAMPVMMKITPQGSIIMPVEPISCLIEQDKMLCDSKEEIRKKMKEGDESRNWSSPGSNR